MSPSQRRCSPAVSQLDRGVEPEEEVQPRAAAAHLRVAHQGVAIEDGLDCAEELGRLLGRREQRIGRSQLAGSRSIIRPRRRVILSAGSWIRAQSRCSRR